MKNTQNSVEPNNSQFITKDEFRHAEFGLYNYGNIARWGAKNLLKFYPKFGTDYGHHEKDLNKAIEVGDMHLEQLANFGMNIPSHERFLGYHPDINDPVVYTVAQEIEGETPEFLEGQAAEECKALLRKQVLEPLFAYFDWARTNGDGYYLNDITGDYQYVYGHPKDSPDEEDKIWLVDLDPSVTKGSDITAIQHLDSFVWMKAINEDDIASIREYIAQKTLH